MARTTLLFISVLATLCGGKCGNAILFSAERNVWKAIAPDGNGNFIPESRNNTIKLNVSTGLVTLSDYDHTSGTIRVGYWLTMSWKVPSLAWDPAKFDGIKYIHVPSSILWVPDILPYKHTDTRHAFDTRVALHSDGTALWVPHVMTTVICKAAGGPKFPRDRKVCQLKLGSWVYNGFLLNLIKQNRSQLDDNLDAEPLESSGWEFVSANEILNLKYYTCCVEPYSDIQVDIIIKRRDNYFSMAVSVPGVISGLLVSLLYLMAPTSSGRVVSQTVCLLILVFVAVTDLRLMGSTVEMAPAAHYYMAAMVLDLFAIVWSIAMGIVWMQASVSASRGNEARSSILRSLECICLLPSTVVQSDTQELHSDSDETEHREQRTARLFGTQCLCLVLDRLLCVINIVLFLILFAFLAA